MYMKNATLASSTSSSSSMSLTSTSSTVSSSSSSTSSSASPTGPVPVQTAGSFAYQGCYTEGTNGRALADTTTASGSMTVAKCAAFCSSYKYMGIEYSSECYCANTISAGAVLTTSGCDMTCSGDQMALCGGPNRLRYECSDPIPYSLRKISDESAVSTKLGPVSSLLLPHRFRHLQFRPLQFRQHPRPRRPLLVLLPKRQVLRPCRQPVHLPTKAATAKGRSYRSDLTPSQNTLKEAMLTPIPAVEPIAGRSQTSRQRCPA